MDTLLDRFCRYVQVDTTANDSAGTYPSSPGQLELGRLLREELLALGVRDVVQNSHGIVYATIPGNLNSAVPVIAWIAHLDVSSHGKKCSARRASELSGQRHIVRRGFL